MPKCYFCQREVEVKERVLRKDTCPHCHRDLHCCVQCRFFDPSYHNQCREPKAEMVRDRDKVNLCDYFEFTGGKPPKLSDDEEKSKRKLEELFRKAGKS